MSLSFISGLLTGCVIGGVGNYLAQKFIKNRPASEYNKNKKIDWEQLYQDHGVFINLIKTDMNEPENRNIREFFVVEPHALLNSSVSRLRYDLTEDNSAAVTQLAELGYIERLPNNCLLYKVQEHFIKQLNSIG